MNLLNFLEENKIEFKLNEKLINHTNFKIGGKCRMMCFPGTIIKTVSLLKFLNANGIQYYVLGNGTNMLCSDLGYNGVIVKLTLLKDYKITKNKVFASAGINLFALNKTLANFGLEGLEFTYGIPGSVGGAVTMNAGAYGENIGDYIESVKAFDGKNIVTICKEKMNFSYRHSLCQEKPLVVLGATFVLSSGNIEQIKQKQNDFFQKRLNSQPYHEPCAGSVFKRLDNGDKPLSKIIDGLGLKGERIGDAEISTIHAGFIVNKGQATCKDVLDLVKYIQNKVYSSEGVVPELEIKLLGEVDDFKR